MQEFGYLFERISLARLMAQHTVIFLPLLILFFAGVATYLVTGDRVRDALAKIARTLLILYISYNLLIALGIGIYLIYKRYV